VVKRLSNDLQQEFPDTTGFSPRNLWNMKNFYEFYAIADKKVQRSVALLPWRHNILIISKVKTKWILNLRYVILTSQLELPNTNCNFLKKKLGN